MEGGTLAMATVSDAIEVAPEEEIAAVGEGTGALITFNSVSSAMTPTAASSVTVAAADSTETRLAVVVATTEGAAIDEVTGELKTALLTTLAAEEGEDAEEEEGESCATRDGVGSATHRIFGPWASSSLSPSS